MTDLRALFGHSPLTCRMGDDGMTCSCGMTLEQWLAAKEAEREIEIICLIRQAKERR